MNKVISTLIILLSTSYLCFSQSPYYSESLIKYDLATHKTDKPIPFDRAFTLVVEKISSKDIVAVHAYEVKFKNGERLKVTNSYSSCQDSPCQRAEKILNAIVDVSLITNPYTDTLQIFFPPIKPNVAFDIQVISKLPAKIRASLLDVNALISENLSNQANSAAYKRFFSSTVDKLSLTSYCSITNYTDYLNNFYTPKISSNYSRISTASNFRDNASLSEEQIKGIDIATSQHVSDFKNAAYLLECSNRNMFRGIQIGTIDINKIFSLDPSSITNLHNGHIRLLNLAANIKFFDSVYIRINRVISKGIDSVLVGSSKISLKTIRTNVIILRNNLQYNYDFLETEMNAVNGQIDNSDELKYGIYLAGNTVSSDLKSAGGSLLFVDAGFANIIAPGLNGNATYIPKLYWGISIYFRPIDKNTRTTSFPRKFTPTINKGCKIVYMKNALGKDSLNNLGLRIPLKFEYGPDYGIVSKWSVWQHLSLNVGVTLGAMTNKDFDNFYNSNSLLLGPSYRFKRAFKISSGVALLKRTSNNPLISDKKVIAGGYISLSVDIDFIQSIKDVTSIFFK